MAIVWVWFNDLSRHQEDVDVKLRSLTPLAVAAGLWLGGNANAENGDRAPIQPVTKQTVQVSNQALANAVAAQLERGHLRGYTIDISAIDGVVELSGRVADSAQHEDVIRQTLSVPGVKSVVDNMMNANFQPVHPAQALSGAESPVLPPPMAGPMAGGPIVDPIPVASPIGGAPYDLNPPKLPPYAWPTYAPYNNFSRVAYPQNYPANAWPFVGPFYPYPKVPLGWRSVTLQWEDGHWYYGRNATQHDYWRVRYW
jgi:hypothetical protein